MFVGRPPARFRTLAMSGLMMLAFLTVGNTATSAQAASPKPVPPTADRSSPGRVGITSAAAGTFVASGPARILDTRNGRGGRAPAGHGVLRLHVAGQGGVPVSGASAVVLNVSVVNPDALGFLSVYPDGTSRPNTSSMNFHSGPTTSNLVVAEPGVNGDVDVYNGAPSTSQLTADVTGYYVAGTPTVAGAFHSLRPARILDTRSGHGGTAPAGHGVLRLPVAGQGGVPVRGASAVVLNVSVVDPNTLGFLSVYPDGTSRPGTSSTNFHSGPTTSNLVVAELGVNGEVDVYNGAPSTTQTTADVTGYYLAGTPSAAGAFVPVTPARILDTRSGHGDPAPAGHGVLRVQTAGQGGIPARGAAALVLNLSVPNPGALGFLSAYPDATSRPGTSSMNFHPGPTTSNLVVARPADNGYLDVYNGAPSSAQLTADVTGYYIAGNRAPDQPTGLDMSPEPYGHRLCDAGTNWLGAITETLTLETSVSDPDGSAQDIYGRLAIWDQGGDGTLTPTPHFGASSQSDDAYNGDGSGPVSRRIAADSLQNGHEYGVAAKGWDGIVLGPSTATCHFWYDSTAPTYVAVSSTDFPPSGGGEHAGQSGQFNLSAADVVPSGAAYSKIDHFAYSTTGPPGSGGEHVNVNPTGPAAAATISLTPTTFGTNYLYVTAVDNAGNVSAAYTYSYYVPG